MICVCYEWRFMVALLRCALCYGYALGCCVDGLCLGVGCRWSVGVAYFVREITVIHGSCTVHVRIKYGVDTSQILSIT